MHFSPPLDLVKVYPLLPFLPFKNCLNFCHPLVSDSLEKVSDGLEKGSYSLRKVYDGLWKGSH